MGISVLSSCDASEDAHASEVISPFTNPSVAFTLVCEEDVKGFQLHPLEQEALGDAVSQMCIRDRYTDELIARFADPDEFDWVRSDPAKRTERAVKLFSAKESIFKALYVLRRVWFAFDVAHLTPKECETGFQASVRLPALSTGVVNLEVGVTSFNGYIITGAWLSNPIQFVTGG